MTTETNSSAMMTKRVRVGCCATTVISCGEMRVLLPWICGLVRAPLRYGGWLALSGRRSVGVAPAAAAAGGRLPAVIRRTVLEEEGVFAQRMAGGECGVGLAG